MRAIREGKGEIGVTTYDIAVKASYDGKVVKKIDFSLTTTIKRAHWTGGKPDDRQKDAIDRAEELNRLHENKHKEIAEDICDDMFRDAAKDLVGKSKKDVDAAAETVFACVDEAAKRSREIRSVRAASARAGWRRGSMGTREDYTIAT